MQGYIAAFIVCFRDLSLLESVIVSSKIDDLISEMCVSISVVFIHISIINIQLTVAIWQGNVTNVHIFGTKGARHL